MEHQVYAVHQPNYDAAAIANALPREVFAAIQPGQSVVLKPNWVQQASKKHPDQWEQVITHPTVISGVIERVLEQLQGAGRIIVTDGPTTECTWVELIAHYPVEQWEETCRKAGVAFELIDLREHEWTTKNDVIVHREELVGDPRGKVETDLLDDASEFWGHQKSDRGYFGADYDRSEVNRAHDGHHNLYSVSRSVIEADVFINLPKLKTHRKAGITCCLKNLVGINTYKNYLPHHNEGSPDEGGDQFPARNFNARVEGPLMAVVKQHVLRRPRLARMVGPLNDFARSVFGQSDQVVRSGNWHGNDTIWRMVLDLNKVLYYVEPTGALRQESLQSRKTYIGIVDAIQAGEGLGPLSPTTVHLGRLFCGTNPVALDAVCATFMGFDIQRIPCIRQGLAVKRYRICDFAAEDIEVLTDGETHALHALPERLITDFEPHFGWKGHIERSNRPAASSR